MPAERTESCPNCGKILPSNAPSGICPTCLMKAAMDGQHDPTVTPASHGSFVPPDVSQLAAELPQLEIIELIGTGGMGAVYKARQTKLARTVALKVLKPDSGDDQAFAERFNREARTLARLSHPNIVGIHDFGEIQSTTQNGQPRTLYYFVMEYVDGTDLRQLMRSRVSPDEVMSIIVQVCEALQFAHEDGVVHRDIKPENILIDARGRVKIADFGLAKLAKQSEFHHTLTGTHQVMGTPRYMAPEQMEGSRTVDHRADVYSLGVVFYELLTGEVPMGQFEPPSRKSSQVDASLDSVVLQAMAREPERRFQSANEMRDGLASAVSGSGPAFAAYDNGAIPGPSTILDLGAKKAFEGIKRQVVGNKKKSDGRWWGIAEFVLCCLGVFVNTTIITMVFRGMRAPAVMASIAMFVPVLLMLIRGPWARGITRPLFAMVGAATAFAFILSAMSTGSTGWLPEVIAAEAPLAPGAREFVENFAPGRAGLYCVSSLFFSLSLFLVGAWDFRSHKAHAASKPHQRKQLPESAHVGFSVPAGVSIASHIAPHFQMLGYKLVDSTRNEWFFERGSKSGHFGVDLRKCFTTLVVRTGSRPDGGQWVSCSWGISAIVTSNEITKLEKEGQAFARAVGVDTVSLTKPGATSSEPAQFLFGILGGAARKGFWKPSSHLIAVGCLGSCEVDLRDAELRPGITRIHIVCAIGGVEVIVPPDVPINVSGIGILGSFEHHGNSPSTSSTTDRQIRITGVSILGGTEIVTKNRD